jgi:hypothetical protein
VITLPLAALVAVNALPLVGVVFLGWQPIPLLLLYWTESAAIGFFNILKILKVGKTMGIGLAVFFTFHFGFFMFVHLSFLGSFSSMAGGDLGGPFGGFDALAEQGWQFHLAAASFFVSHGVSYFVNFLGKREYEGKTVAKQMQEPYARIVVMHVTIVLGGFAIVALRAGVITLAILVVLKTGLDFHLHKRERAKAAKAAGALIG